jgi:cation-transporting P-type ATPase 13A2
VIACATKHIPKLNWVKVQKMERKDAESGLDFIGFIIFENKLKPSTAGVLDELTEAGIRKVMCTGDNILTAISVARECNLIDKSAHCFVPHFAEGKIYLQILKTPLTRFLGDSQDPKARLSWESIDNNIYTLDDNTLTVSVSSINFCELDLTCYSHCLRQQKETHLYLMTFLIFETTLWL